MKWHITWHTIIFKKDYKDGVGRSYFSKKNSWKSFQWKFIWSSQILFKYFCLLEILLQILLPVVVYSNSNRTNNMFKILIIVLTVTQDLSHKIGSFVTFGKSPRPPYESNVILTQFKMDLHIQNTTDIDTHTSGMLQCVYFDEALVGRQSRKWSGWQTGQLGCFLDIENWKRIRVYIPTAKTANSDHCQNYTKCWGYKIYQELS